jgi:hypothetical protein
MPILPPTQFNKGVLVVRSLSLFTSELIIQYNVYFVDGDTDALYTLSQSLGWKGAILAVQLSRFIPSAFPEKSKYINTILREVINPSASVSLDQLETVTPDVSYLLGEPPLEH